MMMMMMHTPEAKAVLIRGGGRIRGGERIRAGGRIRGGASRLDCHLQGSEEGSEGGSEEVS